MIYLKDIMTKVEDTLQINSTLTEAIKLMKKLKWNTIPVTDEMGLLKGVFTRSTLYQMVLDEVPLSHPISSYIKQNVISMPLDTPYDELEMKVKESTVGTGMVVDEENKVIGLFSKTDMITSLFRSTQSLKDQLETILHTSDLGAFLTDNHGVIQFVNDKLAYMLGIEKEQLIDKKIDYILSFKKEKDRIISPQRMEIGSYQTIARLSTYSTIRGNTGFIALFQNVSEVEQLADELETVKNLKGLLDSIIENAYDGIVTVDKLGHLTYLNPPMLELFSLEREHVLDKKIDRILPQLNLSTILETGIADVSEMLEIKGIKYIVHRIPVIQDGQIIGAIGKVMFRQLHEVRELFKKLDVMENKVNFYKQELRKSESSRFTVEQIISSDEHMDKLKKIAVKAAKGRSTILIRGESGTGKELFAHAIHGASARKSGPFVTVNCAAIPDHLLESEFFGYEEGAFTGAKSKGKLGKFDLANGGTLFLDEIGDMSIQLQAKLLRVLQEKEFYRVGGVERVRVDVRIISATNQSLESMVKQGMFREDLFYRLNVISLEIPPLRKRPKDILLLSDIFIKEMNQLISTSVTGFEEIAQKALLAYHWPGNVRELRNVIERGVTFSEHGKIKFDDLPDYIKPDYIKMDLIEQKSHHSDKNLLKQAEQEMIEQALRQSGGNKAKAAKELGISRSVLYTKLKKYNIL